jgi:hypothetical protein
LGDRVQWSFLAAEQCLPKTPAGDHSQRAGRSRWNTIAASRAKRCSEGLNCTLCAKADALARPARDGAANPAQKTSDRRRNGTTQKDDSRPAERTPCVIRHGCSPGGPERRAPAAPEAVGASSVPTEMNPKQRLHDHPPTIRQSKTGHRLATRSGKVGRSRNRDHTNC